MKPAHVIGRVGLFLAALAAAAAAIGALLPVPRFFSEKLGFYERHRDEFDVAFLGSSRFYRGVMPSVFDDAMAARGQSTRSFNLSMVGMRPHEADHYLGRVLAMQPTGLQIVVMELAEWSPVIMSSNRFSARAIAWHTPPETRLALRSSLIELAPLSGRLDLAWTHVLHFAAHQLNLGRGWEIEWRAPPPAHDAPYRALRGYGRLTDEDYEVGMAGRNRRIFVDDLPDYRAAVAELPEANARRTDLPAYNREALARQIERIRAAGVIPVYVLPPATVPTPELMALAESGIVPNLIALNDPRAFPELYAVEHRFDRKHLNERGARLFSQRLAEALVALGVDR